MAAWVLPAIMAAMTVLKANKDVKNAQKQTDLAAATTAYSPWTGLRPNEVQQPNALGDFMEAGFNGYEQYQKGIAADSAAIKADKELVNKQRELDHKIAMDNRWLEIYENSLKNKGK